MYRCEECFTLFYQYKKANPSYVWGIFELYKDENRFFLYNKNKKKR